MATDLRVLLVEDDARDEELILMALTEAGGRVESRRVETEVELRDALAQARWDVILADFQLPQFDGVTALRIVKRVEADLPVVLVSGAIGEEAAVAAMREGASDYVFKGNLRRLAAVVEREVADAALRLRYREAEAALLEASPESTVVISPDGLVARMNRRTHELFGYEREDVIGHPFVRLVPSLGEWNMSNPFGGHTELQGRRRNGEDFPVELTLTPLVSSAGVAFIAAIRDVTERARTLAELRRRAEELAAANEALRAERKERKRRAESTEAAGLTSK